MKDAIVDHEAEVIENMLGAAYVVCQAQITSVTQAARVIPTPSLFGHDLRSLGPRFDERFSKVQVLWALANYFKHRDEWSADTWVAPDGRSRATVEAWFSQLLQSWSSDVRAHILALADHGERQT